MSAQPGSTFDNGDVNCKQCGHQVTPHILIAYDGDDLSKGGEMRCPVAGCGCFHTLIFDLKTDA